MKASELRIGNYFHGDVLCPSEYEVITAKEILDLNDDPLDDYYQPIPITEEWLIKLGFIQVFGLYNNFKVKAGDYWNSVKFIDGEWCYNNDDSDAGCYFVTTIEYVHELQNLYYAINKAELT